jgi:hypothetical protein
MLDVHPPHSPTHTWKDFFIHIATIVIGLLIAVGLEQTVEFVHHREQAREVRESLKLELVHDVKSNDFSKAGLALVLQQLEKNQSVLDSGAIDSEALASLHYDGWDTHRPGDDAWNSAKANGSIALIPARELNGVGYFYETIDNINALMITFLKEMETAAAIVKHGVKRGKLTEAERQKLAELNVSTAGSIGVMSNLYVAQSAAVKVIKFAQD